MHNGDNKTDARTLIIENIYLLLHLLINFLIHCLNPVIPAEHLSQVKPTKIAIAVNVKIF